MEVRYDPMTGEPIHPIGYDPMTGEPIWQDVSGSQTPHSQEQKIVGYDPMTGQPIMAAVKKGISKKVVGMIV
jgi:topoisomerase IA-like protein